MLAVAVIVFREVLEAALIVSIVMAASVGVARPAGMQIIAYVFVLTAIGLPMRVLARGNTPRMKALAVALGGLIVLFPPYSAHAELQVRLPTVEYRELEFEHNGFYTFDKNQPWAVNRATRTLSATA